MCDDCYDKPLPALNASLMRDLLTWARQDKEAMDKFLGWGSWDQEVWGRQIVNGVCKSSYCMAGQAAVQAGYGLVYDNRDEWYDCEIDDWRPCLVAYDAAPQRLVGTDAKGNPQYELLKDFAEPVRNIGQRVLGLAEWEASEFFEGENRYDDLVRLANSYAAARGLEPIVSEDG